jgi:DNA-binding NarL/FixJ family response regulator
MNILIVDDHRLFRIAIIGLLKTSSIHDCDEAPNGQEALEKLRKKSFDLVLLDVSMPVMDGFETCKHIVHEYSNLPVIILTQFDSESLIRHFLDLGVHSFLSKGASADELISAIESAKTGKKNLHSSADQSCQTIGNLVFIKSN